MLSDQRDTSPSTFRDTPSQRAFIEEVDQWLQQLFCDDPSEQISVGRPAAELNANADFWERYEIRRPLGQGSFGVVHLAYDRTLQREVTVKIPSPDRLLSDQRHEQQILAEARHAAGLNHPGIVAVHEVVPFGSLLMIVSTFHDADSLSTWMHTRDHAVSSRDAATCVRQVALAMHHAHQRGVLHRDIKPSNILIPKHERGIREPLITDFGLARRTNETANASRGICGTIRYLAPEAIAARSGAETIVADIYSLGLVLFEMLTGELPFREVDSAALSEMASRKMTWSPADRLNAVRCNSNLRAIVSKCVGVDPNTRYQSAAELAADLGCYLDDRPVQARTATWPERAYYWCRREPRLVAVAGISVVAIVASLAAVVTLLSREHTIRMTTDARTQTLREILRESTGQFASDRFVNVPRTDSARLEVLTRAVKAYRQLAAEQTFSEQSTYELSVALHRLANTHSQSGRSDLGLKYHKECLELIGRLTAMAPDNINYRYDEFVNAMLVAAEINDKEQAWRTLQQASDALNRVIDAEPDNPVYLEARTTLLNQLGGILQLKGLDENARETLDQAARESRKLFETYPDRPLYGKNAVVATMRIAHHYRDSLDFAQAKRFYSEAAVDLQLILERVPDDRFLRSNHCEVALCLGICCMHLDLIEEAEREFQLAEERSARMAADYPEAAQYRSGLAEAKFHHATLCITANREAEAEQLYRDAFGTWEAIVAEKPGSVEFAKTLAARREECLLRSLRGDIAKAEIDADCEMPAN